MGERYFVRDGAGNVVALLPGETMGEMVTGTGRWFLGLERPKRGWRIAARSEPNATPAGWASPSWLPAAYTLVVASDKGKYRLRRNPLTGNWRLRHRRATIARLVSGSNRPRARRSGTFRAIYPASIELPTGRIGAEKLTLLIGLALEAVKCESAIAYPAVGSAGG